MKAGFDHNGCTCATRDPFAEDHRDDCPLKAKPRLVWHCNKCGTPEVAHEDYEHGDVEPCVLCDKGVARVMTEAEAEAAEKRRLQRRRETQPRRAR